MLKAGSLTQNKLKQGSLNTKQAKSKAAETQNKLKASLKTELIQVEIKCETKVPVFNNPK